MNDNQMVVCIILIVGSCLTVATIAIGLRLLKLIDDYHRRSIAVELKRDLLERGFSFEEIVTLIETTPLPIKSEAQFLTNRAKRG